jgi:Ca2+:H+ antiporter
MARRGPSIMEMLLVLIPIAVVLRLAGANPAAVFLVSAAAIIPLAGFMGRATEELARHAGPGIGGLLNVTFGNATELIIAFAAMQAGLMDVVKASLTGSVIGNLLLVLGLSMLAGGMKWKEQKFSIRAAGTYNSLMVIALIGMTIPALFFYAGGSEQARQNASVGVSVLLLAVYALAMVFSLHTHKHIFNPLADDKEAPAGWSRQKAILVLAGSAVVVGLLSEILVGSVEQAARSLGLSDLFVGVVIVAVIGNAAEHGVAVTVAMRDKMDLSFAIATGSSAQVALFVAPLLVLAGLAIGRPMDLFFEVFELAAMGLAVAAVIMVSQDGESNWFEGSLLLSVYLMMGIVFYFHP